MQTPTNHHRSKVVFFEDLRGLTLVQIADGCAEALKYGHVKWPRLHANHPGGIREIEGFPLSVEVKDGALYVLWQGLEGAGFPRIHEEMDVCLDGVWREGRIIVRDFELVRKGGSDDV